jgi:two-component SAPR family response regulator
MPAPAKPLIISVDDESTILRLVKLVLEPFYRVMTFTDTSAALKTMQTARPDLVICDINMPEIDGFELHATLRDDEALRGVPFIYLTALADRETFRKGMLQGADDYLVKPFSPEELRQAVRTRLERTQTLRTENTAEPWIISTLGGAAIFADGSARDFHESKKGLELFLFLVTNDNRASHQEVARNLWWGSTATNTLHSLISRARKTFADLAEFDVKDESISTSVLKPYRWDADIFEKEAQAALKAQSEAAIERAIRLYKGNFLPTFSSPWTEERGNRYEELYLKLLEVSAEVASSESSRKHALQRLQDYMGLE